jgi:hypothetical protein
MLNHVESLLKKDVDYTEELTKTKGILDRGKPSKRI